MAKKLKICLLGATGVGKTSLVSRFVRSIFSDSYLTTVGVAIDKAQVHREGQDIDLVVWDLSGQDEFQSVQLSYLRGAAGYLLVVDGTRRETLATALSLQQAASKLVGKIPLVLVLNKADQIAAWDLGEDSEIYEISRGEPAMNGWSIVKTSAKTGDGVEGAFGALVDEVLKQQYAVARKA